MSLPALSRGSIQRIHAKQQLSPQRAIVQVVSIQRLAPPPSLASNRWKCALSDGEHWASCLFSPTLNALLEDEYISLNSIVSLKDYRVHTVQQRQVIVVLALDIVVSTSNTSSSPPLARLGQPQPCPAIVETSTPNDASSAVIASITPPEPAPFSVPSPSTSNAEPLLSISALKPYQQGWTIKVRVTWRSGITRWSNARGEGRLFRVELIDASGEIRATAFNDMVDRLEPLLAPGKVFLISKAKITPANTRFSSLPHPFEILLERQTLVEECHGDSPSIPRCSYAFVPLAQISEIPNGDTCDVLVVVTAIGAVAEVVAKTSQQPILTRELTVMDASLRSCRLTLWGKTAETYSTEAGINSGLNVREQDHAIIALKGAKVTDFAGRSLSMTSTTTMAVDPDLPATHQLRGWYEADGKDAILTPFAKSLAVENTASTLITLADAPGDNSDEPIPLEFLHFQASVFYIQPQGMYYAACPLTSCSKKVRLEDNGSWHCDKCHQSYPEPHYSYVLNVNVKDQSAQLWLTCFNDTGEQLIGQPASELRTKQEHNETLFAQTLQQTTGRTFIFHCRAQLDLRNESKRVRYTVIKLAAVDDAAAEAQAPGDSSPCV